MRRWSPALALAALACGAEPSTLRLDLPTEGHRAALLSIEPRDPRVEAGAPAFFALDLAAPEPVMQTFEPGAALAVTALLFSGAPAAVGLAPGPVAARPESEATRPLPAAAAILRTAVDDGGAGAWVALDEVPAPLADLRLAATPTCVEVIPEGIDWRADAPARWLSPWRALPAPRPDRVIAGLDDDRLVVLSADGATELRWDGPAVEIDAAHPGPDGALLGTVGEGELWIAGIDVGAELVSARLHGLMAAHFEGSRISGPPEIEDAVYVLAREWHSGARADNGHLVRYFLGGRAGGSLHYYPPDPALARRNEGDVAWVGPDATIALWTHSQDVVSRYEGGAVHQDPIPGPRTVEHVAGWGTLVGTEDGRVFLRPEGGDRWRVVATHDERIDHIVATESRGWLIDGRGRLLQLVPERGICPGVIELPVDIERAAGLEDAVVLAGRPRDGSARTGAVWLSIP